MAVVATTETIVRELAEDTLDATRQDYGLPDTFGVGDGLVRVVIHPTTAGLGSHASAFPVLRPQLEGEARAQTLARCARRAWLFARAAYQRQHGVEITPVSPSEDSSSWP
jgi:hypothetical protein